MQHQSDIQIPLFESFCRQNAIDGKYISAKVSGIPLNLKVVSTPESMMKGYSNQPSPKDGEGMLFVYQDEMPLEFWMKGVNHPLDVMFFNSNRELVDHLTMDPCGDLIDIDLPIYRSKKPAMFAVEVAGGWCKNRIRPGCSLEF
jgi:uncharacterized membrane protein (UPF0127 family)